MTSRLPHVAHRPNAVLIAGLFALAALSPACGAGDGGAGDGGAQPAAPQASSGGTAGTSQGTGTSGAPPSSSGAAGSAPDQPAASTASFDWPEGAVGGSCLPGHYVGTFECTYVPTAGGMAPLPISGNIDMTLMQMQNGEFLEVQNGKLQGNANGSTAFGADLSGKLDCATARFDGALVNGAYSFLGLFNGAFGGPLSADYDETTHSMINGVWEMQEAGATSNGTCNGTWTARLQP